MICKGDRLCVDNHLNVVVSGVNKKKNFLIVFVYDSLPFGEDTYCTTLSFKERGQLRRDRNKNLLLRALKPFSKK